MCVCVWNIAQMMLFNCCSEEMTAVPIFFVFPWDRGAVLDSDHAECPDVKP